MSAPQDDQRNFAQSRCIEGPKCEIFWKTLLDRRPIEAVGA
jgi:hypothetical protein